jgi:hypothetical protein
MYFVENDKLLFGTNVRVVFPCEPIVLPEKYQHPACDYRPTNFTYIASSWLSASS